MARATEKWDWLLDLIFDSGVMAERNRIAETYSDLDAQWRERPRRSYEERVAERIAEMEQCAAEVAADMGRPGYEFKGGPTTRDKDGSLVLFDPVPWDGPGHGGTVAARLREHDRRCVELGLKMEPAYVTWEQVQESVTPLVWARIFYDLHPSTRDELAHIAPPGWRRGLAVAE